MWTSLTEHHNMFQPTYFQKKMFFFGSGKARVVKRLIPNTEQKFNNVNLYLLNFLTHFFLFFRKYEKKLQMFGKNFKKRICFSSDGKGMILEKKKPIYRISLIFLKK